MCEKRIIVSNICKNAENFWEILKWRIKARKRRDAGNYNSKMKITRQLPWFSQGNKLCAYGQSNGRTKYKTPGLYSCTKKKAKKKKKKRHPQISKHVSRDKLVQTSLILNIKTESYNNLQNSNINTLCNYCYKKMHKNELVIKKYFRKLNKRKNFIHYL